MTGSSEQVASISRDLEAASIEQLDTITGTISASHEISSMVSRTSDSTSFLTSEAEQLKKMSDKGSSFIGEMVGFSLQMKEGSEHFKTEIEKSMQDLSGTLSIIREIASKTQLINDIVFQTKLLSFNASVEAARAGEHGKGFAVVAEEIGKLAQMSGRSADEISSIVDKSVSSITSAIETAKKRVDRLTTEGQKRNEQGYESTKNCETVFINISEKINSINQMIEEISVATKEQSIGVNQLDLAIIKLQEVADRNRLVASQSTEHAIEFELQTKKITEINQELATSYNFDTYQKPRLQKFVWTEKLTLGVKEMDDEHKVLVERINSLVEALEHQYIKKDTTQLLEAFTNLANYTVQHFKDEEAYMLKIGYGQLSSHKKIHEKLLNQVGAYGEQIQTGMLDDKKLISFLRNWLMSHIMGVDMQYADHQHAKRPLRKVA
ncbi:MAG: bacteriohemerythrin [Bacteriovorax sp.]